MKILFIGDVFGKPGRQILKKHLPTLIKEHQIDVTIANVENIAHGKGTRPKDIDYLRELGVDVFTGGNHSFDNKDFVKLIQEDKTVIRPANYPPNTKGNGYYIYKNILIINLIGRVFVNEGLDSPFQIVDKIIADHKNINLDGIFIDFHAETTSEKKALACYLDGQVSAVIGTHTHVQTADEQILTNGTAFITDAGMTGPGESIIGMDIDSVMKKFLTAQKSRFEPATKQPQLCAVMVEIENKKAINIERIFIKE